MSTKQLLSDARERLTVSRLGKSIMRESDKDLIVIRRLIEALDTPQREAARVDELNARQDAYRQHREDFALEHEHSPEIATSAFFDGWDAAVGARFRRSEVPEQSAEHPDSPEHLTTNEKLRDLHARWHDQPGNLVEVCEWQGCEFWESAKFTLRMADVQAIGRVQGEPSDAAARDVLYFALRDAGEGRKAAENLSRKLTAALRAAGAVQ